MASEKSSTTVYIGNLTTKSRLTELKSCLLNFLQKTLKLHVTSNDISIINGSKRYALVDVHNEQNVDFLIEKLSDGDNRNKIKFNFDQIVEQGTFLYIDKVKSNDDKQARDDFENAKNLKPFQKPHLHTRKRPEYDVVVPLRPTTTSKSFRAGSRLSSSSLKSQSHLTPRSFPSTDLDVTLPDSPGQLGAQKGSGSGAHQESGEVMNKRIDMIPLADSTLKTHEDSDDSGTQMDSIHNQTLSSIHGEGDDFETSTHHSDYEDPPGSVIDMRHVGRSSIQGKITPRIHRRTARTSKSSASRRDFFDFLDRQVGAESSESDNDVTLKAETNDDEGTPYYRPGEVINNTDYSKEFKSYLDGRYTLKQIRDHVSRCICAFLNTGKKGMLLIGVDSRGRVVGIECNAQQEARYLQHFLDAVKDIYPPVFGEEYSFHFSPLLEDNGRQHPSLKVIEVRVFPPHSPDVLYECKEGVFVRRNGVLTGPIRPSHIQEWIKQKHFAELDDMHNAENFLKDELNKKDETIRQQGDTIRSQKSEIERQRNIIESKSCNIL